MLDWKIPVQNRFQNFRIVCASSKFPANILMIEERGFVPDIIVSQYHGAT
jgi:hypothetical protein